MTKTAKPQPGQPESRTARKPVSHTDRRAENRPTSTPAPARESLSGIVRRAESDPASLAVPALQRLQHTVGNRALTRLTPAGGGVVQAKLQVGPAGDEHEQEADRVAARVVAMPAPAAPAAPGAPGQGPLQRQGQGEDEDVQAKPLVQRAAKDEDEDVQAKPLVQRAAKDEDENIQAKAQDPGAGFEANSAFEERLNTQQGSGSPLPGPVRAFMEPRFGADFSSVHLHTGGESAQLNRAIGAQAFTRGSDIYLGEGKENLASGAGRELLAHELTHTIQQGAAPLQRQPQPAPDENGQIQRHSETALAAQIQVSSLEDEEPVQTRRADIQRHPIAPSVEVGHEAPFGDRQVEGMKAIATASSFIQKVRDGLTTLVTDTLTGTDQQKKLLQIQSMQWQLNGDIQPANPAQVKGGAINLFFYHPNFYKPDGSPRVEFIKSVVLHEGLHYISHDHTGFQDLAALNTHAKGSLAGADSLDEAVTEKISADVAGSVLGVSEAYTTNYWNLEARRGLDVHLTFQGLELLATGQPKLWLGKMVDVIIDKTGLTWPQIKAAYLTDEAQDPEVRTKIEAKRAEIGAEWKTRSETALLQQLGKNALPKAEWESELRASIQAVDEAAAKTNQPPDKLKQSKEQIKAAVDEKLFNKLGVPHVVVPNYSFDARSSSLDDWKIVRDNTPNIDPDAPPKTGSWTEAVSQAKWGVAAGPAFGSKATEQDKEKTDNPNTKEWAGPIPDIALKNYVRRANLLLGNVAGKSPMGWVIVPKDMPIMAGDKFSTYPARAVQLLQPENMNQSLSSLTGANATLSARAVLDMMGGAGYEANGKFGALNVEHVNQATVIHEMGHHKQHVEQGFNEQTISQIKGVFPLLDLHNILISENKLAAAELTKDKQSNPYVRLRYTSTPVRLRVSDWVALAAKQTEESGNYKRFKDRLAGKGGKLADIVADIERELKDNPGLYPGNVPILFKNMMVEEIMSKNPGRALEIEKSTDIGHK